MKKTVKSIVLFALVIAVFIVLLLLLRNASKKSQTNLDPINSGEDLLALVDKLYEGQDNLYPTIESYEVDTTDTDRLKSLTGLENADNLEYVVASEPMINAQAYSLILVKVKKGINANEVAKEMSEKVDPRKWICATAEKLYATSSGNVAFLIMTENDIATSLYEKFKSLSGNIGEVYEKDNVDELPVDDDTPSFQIPD